MPARKNLKKVATKKSPDKDPLTIRKDSFFVDVFDVARLIPKGRVTSYGAIAKYLGAGLSARMVGWAMNAAHVAKPKIPAHRVVNRLGMLSGKHHFGSPTRMEELLKKEGIEVKKDQIVGYLATPKDQVARN